MFYAVQEEGLFKLWKGLPAAVVRHMGRCGYAAISCACGVMFLLVYSGCRMTFYEYIRENIFKRNKQGKYPLW